jgi:hypothetical protein
MSARDHTTVRTERLLDAGSLLIALGALALAVSLFLDWYGIGFDQGVSAWTTFELVDLVLIVLALAAIVAIAERLFVRGRPPLLPTWVHVVCGPIALVIVCVQLIDEPPAVGAAATIEIGGWIAFAGAAVMTIGALLTRVRISLVVGARDRPASAAPADPDAETRRYPTE